MSNITAMVRKYVEVKANFRTVEVRIRADEEMTLLFNEFIITRSFSLKQGEVAKCIIDKKDVIIYVPMRDVTVAELFLEVDRCIFGRAVTE